MYKALEKQMIQEFKKQLNRSPVTINISFKISNPLSPSAGSSGCYENVKALVEIKDHSTYKDNKMATVIISGKHTFKIDSSYEFNDKMTNIVVTWGNRKFQIDKPVPAVPLSDGTFLCTLLIQE